ncbi:MAG: aminotransferase class I/II-fold pyridoxal phosphate-dependent enzyme [Flavobacteriales bacterium]|nr:aminotransferase class I/II-fold pyridoxal phosphate-dependent enzyme [Flavobacteriales bacterium]
MDLFDKLKVDEGHLGRYARDHQGYFTFPKLEGEIGSRMKFRGKEVLCWSLNNYIGLANHPEVRRVDAEAAKEYGLGLPMGARMMSGNSTNHEKLEAELSSFMKKEDTILLNYGYQGMVSAIDALLDRKDVAVYDSESHACIVDGVRLHHGKRFVFQHNNIENLRKQLERATTITKQTEGAILVITEGVFGMSGDQGKLKEIIALKKEFNFRLFVDDAHGFGTMGATGAGTGEEQGVQDGIDIYFGTFAKAMASIGAFISSEERIIQYMRYTLRSQIFAKSLPMPLVVGALKRLELLRTEPALKEQLWTIVRALQDGLKKRGFNLGNTNSPVTPVFLTGALEQATNLAFDLRENFGIFCSIVIYPVVPKGVIMIRLIPTAMHTLEDVEYTLDAFSKIKERLEAGEYAKASITAVE